MAVPQNFEEPPFIDIQVILYLDPLPVKNTRKTTTKNTAKPTQSLSMSSLTSIAARRRPTIITTPFIVPHA